MHSLSASLNGFYHTVAQFKFVSIASPKLFLLGTKLPSPNSLLIRPSDFDSTTCKI